MVTRGLRPTGLTALCLFLAWTFLPGTGAWAASDPPRDGSAAARPESRPVGLRIGILKVREPDRDRATYEPVWRNIERETGLAVEALVLDTAELESAVRDARIDLLYTNPVHYQLLRSRYRLGGPLATTVRAEAGRETATLGGVVIASATRPGNLRWQDLPRLRIASPGSDFLGGYHTQLHELLRRGLPAPRRMLWVGTHDAVIEAVLDGRADAGFLRTGVIEQLSARGGLDPARLRVIEPASHRDFPFKVSTALYPEWPVVAMPQVEPRLVRRIATALMEVDLSLPATYGGQIAAFVPPADYTTVTELALALRLPPFDSVPRGEWQALWQAHPVLMPVGHALGFLALVLGALLWRVNRRLAAEGERALTAEALLRELVDQLPIGIIHRGDGGEMRMANRTGARLLPMLDAALGEDWSTNGTLAGVAGQRRIETALGGDGGPVVDVDVRVLPTLDARGAMTGTLALIEDITARKAAQHETQQRQRLQSRLEVMSRALLAATAADLPDRLAATLTELASCLEADEGCLAVDGGCAPCFDLHWPPSGAATPPPLDLLHGDWLQRRLDADGSVVLDGRVGLPPEAAGELAGKEISALLVVRIALAGDHRVTLGVCCRDHRRHWTDFEQDVLRQLATTIGEVVARAGVEQRLRDAEAYNRAIVNALPDVVLIFDAEDRYLDVRGPTEYLAAPPEAVVGRHLVDIVGDDLAARAREQLAAARSGDGVPSLEYALDLADGQHWFESRAGRLDGGRVLCLIRDVSAQRRVEHALARESGFADLLVHLAASYINVGSAGFDATPDIALQRIAEYVRADRGYMFRIDEDAGVLRNTHEWCASGVEPVIGRLQGVPIGSIAGWVEQLRAGSPVLVEDVAGIPEPEMRAFLEDQGVRSMVWVPMMQDGRCVGFVGFDAVHAIRRFSGRELQLLEAFALMQVNLLLQGQARAEIEAQRQRLAIILEGTAAGTWIWWPRSSRLVVNDRWATMLGYGLDELEPVSIATWQRLSHPDDLKVAERALQRNIDGELEYYEAEVRMRHRDGHWVWVLTRGRVVRKEPGPDGLVVAGIHQQIDDRKQAEARLVESEQRFRSLLEDLPTIAVRGYGPDLVVRFWNKGSERLYGWTSEEAVGRELTELIIPPERRAEVRRVIAGWFESGQPAPPGELLLARRDGSQVPVYSSHALQRNARGEMELFCADLDLSEQKRAAERLELSAKVFSHSHEGILITDRAGVILDVNEAFTRITGYSREEALGRKPSLLRSGQHPPEHFRAMWASLAEQGYWSGEMWNRRRDGELYVEYLTISAVHDTEGTLTHYVGLFSDITTQKEYQHRLEHIAHYDALTGLPNRVLLADRIRQAMARSRRSGKRLALAFVDLDGFKSINDSHGHDTGDQVLRRFGERLSSMLREGDTVARIGGDEFVALLVDVGPVEDMRRLLDRLLVGLRDPIVVGDLTLVLSGSIGVSMYPQEYELDAEQLLRQADQAMYRAKHAGKNRVGYFDADLERQYRQRADLLAELEAALEDGQFVLHYQPKTHLRQGRIVGVEALIRWQHPHRGLLLPGQFLPVLEAEPLALQLGHWVMRQAVADLAAWRAEGLDVGVSINVAAQQIVDAGFAEQLRQVLAAHPGLPKGSLTLEVLETSLIGDLDHAAEVFRACNRLGVAFSLDDFGTGYSSLSYLKTLPLAELKIDQSFVRDMLVDPEDLAIVDGIIGLSRAFKLTVIAEGVESADQIEALLRLGCAQCQGNHIAAAMPRDSLRDWIRQWRPEPTWGEISPLERAALPLLLAEVEHRAWVQHALAYVERPGEREPPPSRDRCPLDLRLADLPPAIVARLDMAVLEPCHEAIHALVDDARAAAGDDAFPERAGAFRTRLRELRDALIAELRRGMQRTVAGRLGSPN